MLCCMYVQDESLVLSLATQGGAIPGFSLTSIKYRNCIFYSVGFFIHFNVVRRSGAQTPQ